jgi:hypothetical protein
LNYLLARAKDPSTASNRLDKQIQDTQKELTEINKKRLPLLKEETKLVADIGPIKYVADMFFEGDSAVDKAVRLVILLIMLVFDPLAVLLLIAGNISLKQKQEQEPKEVEVENGTITKIHFAPVEKKTDSVEIEKENLATIGPVLDQKSDDEVAVEETDKVIEIDGASGETIPSLQPKGKRGFPNRKTKDIDSKYDESSELAFREKKEGSLDGGNF